MQKTLEGVATTFKEISRCGVGRLDLGPLLELLSTSNQLKQGYRILIVLVGAAKDHLQALEGPPPT